MAAKVLKMESGTKREESAQPGILALCRRPSRPILIDGHRCATARRSTSSS